MGMAAGRSRPMAASSSERGRRWSARLTARSKVGDIRAAPAERYLADEQPRKQPIFNRTTGHQPKSSHYACEHQEVAKEHGPIWTGEVQSNWQKAEPRSSLTQSMVQKSTGKVSTLTNRFQLPENLQQRFLHKSPPYMRDSAKGPPYIKNKVYTINGSKH
uniref:Uncharacterized protein n=1 Tax=Oryza nivara TaxID=4536 RepID=A0A0E0GTT1_ORYNI